MYGIVNNLKKEIDKKVCNIEKDDKISLIDKSLAVIQVLEAAHDKLREYIILHGFKDIKEEIIFYKKIKPDIFKHLVYWRKIYNLKMNEPQSGNHSLLCYYEEELEDIQKYTIKRLDFYRYYRQGASHLDEFYFTRNQKHIDQYLENFHYGIDPEFTTVADIRVTRILANDMLQFYLMEQINNIKNNQIHLNTTNFPKTKLTWNLSKSDLIEIIYGFNEVKAFGKVNISTITDYFERIFNIDLGNNISRSFNDMKIRNDNISFINSLAEHLRRKMNQNRRKFGS